MIGSGTGDLITISASDVELTFDGSTLSNAARGIVVTGDRVTIMNGSIDTMSTAGLVVSGSKCVVHNLEITNATKGIVLSSSVQNSFKNCRVVQSSLMGIELISSSTNSFIGCDILDTSSNTANIYGIYAHGGCTANTFEKCSIKGVKAYDASHSAFGILLEDVDQSYLTGCAVVDVLSEQAQAFGINLDSSCENCSLMGNTVKYINALAGTTSADAIGIKVQSDYLDAGSNVASKNYVSDNVSGPINYGPDANSWLPGQYYSSYVSGSAGVNPALIKYETDYNRAGFNIWVQSPSSASHATPVDPEAAQLNAIQSTVEAVSVDLDACCFTTGSKLDVLSDVMVNQFNVVNANLDEIDTALQLLTASELDHFVSTFEQLIGVSEDLLTTMTQLQEVAADVEATLTDLDTLLSNVAQLSLDVQDLEVDLDVHNDVINSKLDVIDTEVGALTTAVGVIDTEVGVINGKVDTIDTEVGVINGKVDTIDTEVGVIDTKIGQLGTSIGDVLADTLAIESKVDVIDTEVGALTTAVGVIDTEVGVINGKVDTIDTEVGDLALAVGVIDTELGVVNANLTIVDGIVDTIAAGVVTLDGKVDTIDTEVGVINGKVDTIDGVVDGIAVNVSAVDSKIDQLIAGVGCDATGLAQADVVGGALTLSTAGNYCLSENLTSTIYITADNVSLCLNDRELTGCVQITGKDALIKNGRIAVPSSLDSTNAISLVAGADTAIISNIIAVVDSGAGARGSALSIAANDAVVENSIFKGGISSASSGGNGVSCSACSRVTIRSSLCSGGSGTSTDGAGVSVVSGASLVTIANCTLESSEGNGATIGGSAIDVLDSLITASTLNASYCVGCVSPAARVHILNCRLDGKDAQLQSGTGDGINVASGCSGVEVRDCTIFGCADKAIEDSHNATVANYSSVMYNNFAYDIAGATKYQIRNKSSMGESYGVDLVSGTPGLYSNVYIP
jgi:DNA polymerase-3 subunit gamma/tau